MALSVGSAHAGDLCEREALTGERGGARTALAYWGVLIEGAYIGDVIANVRGGRDRDTVYLDNLDLTLTANLPTLTGLPCAARTLQRQRGEIVELARVAPHPGRDLQSILG